VTAHTILIVEDDDMSRRLLRDVLRFHSYCVIEAATGNDAIMALKAKQFDLALMDIQLPDISGFEVLKQLREMPQHAGLPVAAVTASVMDYDRKRIKDAGFTAYIAKPLSLDHMLAEVKRLIEEGV
jgi:CheY-like chemotaxis protein